ncbi:MAG: ParA family protein [Promethearchaeota archaeon]
MKVFLFNSYKGGSGKTTVAANIGVSLAKRNKKVALIDWDLQGPSLHTLLGSGNKDEPRLFDFLEKRKPLLDVIHERELKNNIYLWVCTHTVDFDIIEKLTDKEMWKKITVRLIREFREFAKEELFDYILFDTGPGLSYHTAGLMMACEAIYFVVRPDAFDTQGLEDTLIAIYSKQVRKKYDLKAYFILGKIPQNFDQEKKKQIIHELQEKHALLYTGEVSCYCDIAGMAANTLYTLEEPNHPFSKEIEQIVDFIERTNV